MLKKSLFSMVLVGMMVFSSVGASAVSKDINGWGVDKQTKQWVYYIKGEKVKDTVLQQGNNIYYFNEEGNLRNGWSTLNGKQMYFDGGIRKIGWFKYNNNWYYLNNSGEMQTNTIIDGYTINSEGVWVQ